MGKRRAREGNEDPGYLFLRGEKIRIALPLRLSEARKKMFAGSQERRKWLESYSQGVNIHNPCSSFLSERSRGKWNGIREKEPFAGTDELPMRASLFHVRLVRFGSDWG